MRIAFVAPFGLRAKGTTRARALPLATSLAARGHTMALFIPPYDSPDDSGKRWEEAGVDVINLPLPASRRGLRRFAHLSLAWRALRAVRRWEPHTVHIFKPKGPSGLVGTATWLIGQVRRAGNHRARVWGWRPSLVVDSDDWEGPGGWNDDRRAGYSVLERRFFAWQESYGLSHADAWTVSSACLRDRAVRFGATAARVFVLPNGVPASRVSWHRETGPVRADDQTSLQAIKDQPSALLYTRFAGVRAQDVAAIWNEVRVKVPEARLTVVGSGLASEEEALRNLPGIFVRGWVDPFELPAELAAADVAVVPWADTPSNRARHSAKVLELMAAGLPIVAFAVGELPVTLGDGGLLVEPGDHVAFASAVVALFGDRELARRLGAAAKRRVLAEYTWERLAQIPEEAYRVAGMYKGDTMKR